jgi:GH25 family lysozyme M1 (1,4-beta-N-acetylmuramidase)
MSAGGDRYGLTWFRGAYHFGVPNVSGATQADFALDTIDRAGGWHDGDMPLAWDIEGDAWNDDKKLRRKISMEFAARVLQRTGRRPEFYGNGDIGIGPDDGFGGLWTPHPKRLGGWPVARWNLYQYAGDGKYYDPNGIPAKKKFPLYIPGWGLPPGEDMNTVLEGGVTVKDVTKLRGRLTGLCK